MRYCNPMRFGALLTTLVLVTSVAGTLAARPGQRPSSMPQTSPRTRPAPAPPAPPRAPRQPTVTPPIVAPQPPFVPAPQTSSPFDATRRTYAPAYDGRSRHRYGPPYYSSAIGIGELVTGAEGPAVPDDVVGVPESPDAARLTSPVVETPRMVVASRGPDTYYVIPGCYAGNHPPDPQRLPKGCDAAKVRTTPVR